NAEHHREGDAVAPHLDEFLGEDRAEIEQGEAGHDGFRSSWARPPPIAMKWMNTSSRLVSPGATVTPSSRASGASAAARRSRSIPETCSVAPNGATCSTPSSASMRAIKSADGGAVTTNVDRPDARTISGA